MTSAAASPASPESLGVPPDNGPYAAEVTVDRTSISNSGPLAETLDLTRTLPDKNVTSHKRGQYPARLSFTVASPLPSATPTSRYRQRGSTSTNGEGVCLGRGGGVGHSRHHFGRGTVCSDGYPSILAGPAKTTFTLTSSRARSSHSTPVSRFCCIASNCFRQLIIAACVHHGRESETRVEALNKLSLFPLRFKPSELEREYRSRMVESYPCRLITTAVAWLVICLILWVGIAAALVVFPVTSPGEPYINGLVIFHATEKVVLHIFFSVLCILDISLIIAPCTSFCRGRLELVLFVFLTLSETVAVSWNGFVFLTAARTLSKIKNGGNTDEYDEFYNYRMWTGMLLVLLRITEILCCTVAVPTRTQVTLYFVVCTLANHALLLVLANFVIFAELAHPQAGLLSFFTVFIVGVLGFVGRYMTELYDRLYLYYPMERYRAVQRFMRKTKRHTTSSAQKLTVLELILENLQRAKDCVAQDQNMIDAPTALSLIDQSIAMLAQTNKFVYPGAAFPVALTAVKEFVLGRTADETQCGPFVTDSLPYTAIGALPGHYSETSLSASRRASVRPVTTGDTPVEELEHNTSQPVAEKRTRHFADLLLRSPRSQRFLVFSSTVPPLREPPSDAASPRHTSLDATLLTNEEDGASKDLAGTTAGFSARRLSLGSPAPLEPTFMAMTTPLPDSLPVSATLGLDHELISQLEGVGRDWELDVLRIGQNHSQPMIPIGKILLHSVTTSCTSAANADPFLSKMSNLYQPNPYHSELHACMVAHAAMCLSRSLGLWNYWGVSELAALIIAALGHDVAHRGRNNSFYINAVDPLVVMYNEQSPLENFHACLTMQLVRQDQNIFGSFSEKFITRMFRKHVVEFILVTDMTQHFDTISRLRVRKASPDFDFYSSLEDFLLVGKLCMKAGDLSHTAVHWNNHLNWSLRVCEEFYQQGDEERQLGLPLSPLCDRALHHELAKAQTGFIDFVALPVFQELQTLLGGTGSSDSSHLSTEDTLCDHCCQQMQRNASQWEKISDLTIITIPKEFTKMSTNLSPIFDAFCDAFEACILDAKRRRTSKTSFEQRARDEDCAGNGSKMSATAPANRTASSTRPVVFSADPQMNPSPSILASSLTVDDKTADSSKPKLNKRTPLSSIAAVATAPFSRFTKLSPVLQ